jgi:hypothetical protein
MRKEGKRTALMGTGNRGISGKWGRNMNSLLHWQARQRRDTEIPD